MQFSQLKRREFISLLGGAAAWPLNLVARAQQPERMRRIGVLAGTADEARMQARYEVFRQALAQLGWTDGRNMRIDYRWGEGGGTDIIRKHAAELAALAPDVILVTGGASLGAMLEATRTVPIVFVIVPDPVGSGFIDSLSRPGGNATGFMQFEYSLCGKWLELLKEIAPRVTRAAVLWDPTLPAGIGQFAIIQSVASALGVEVIPISTRNASEIERALAAFAGSGNSGIVVTATTTTFFHRKLIAMLATQHRLPSVTPGRDYGGLMSYGADFIDQYRRAGQYVHRILKGEKPADLPVQAPTKYELVINLKTAKALGLEVPPTLLARADEVIE
jgi:putative ABC transport system substrate-binding protein